MSAKLSNYQPIAGETATASQAVMPTDIEIDWPLVKSKMHIVLSEMSTKQVNPAVFRYTDHSPAMSPEDEIQIDAEEQAEELTQ